MTFDELFLYLKERTEFRLHLRLNQNRSRLIGVSWPDRLTVRISLHELFLNAPLEVLDAIALFASQKERRESRALLRRFINGQSPPAELPDLVTKGRYFDLESVQREVSESYFGGELTLPITWFGRKGRARRFGDYCRDSHLVRIHRQLDRAAVPWQFLHFVVYHEMLHHVVPAHVASSGRIYPHTAEFRRREREFAHYEWAKRWERNGWA